MERWWSADSNALKLRRLYWTCAALLVLASMLALGCDLRVDHWLRDHPPPGDLRRLILTSEFFGHGLSVLVLIWAAAELDGRRLAVFWRLLISAYAPGLVCTLIKGFVARQRPEFAASTVDVWATFVSWFPVVNPPPQWGYALQSFPSSHTATAVGLAVGLAAIYPRGWRVFAVFALLASVQRVVAHAHFTSDVLFGAAIAFAVSGWWATCRWYETGVR